MAPRSQGCAVLGSLLNTRNSGSIVISSVSSVSSEAAKVFVAFPTESSPEGHGFSGSGASKDPNRSQKLMWVPSVCELLALQTTNWAKWEQDVKLLVSAVSVTTEHLILLI